MSFDTMAQSFSVLLPWATFGALAVTIIIVVWKKGTWDAMKNAAETYKTLAESYKETIAEQTERLEACEKKVDALESKLTIERAAIQIAIDETIKSFARHGYCAHAGTCKAFHAGDVEEL